MGYAPDGSLLTGIELPVERPTSCSVRRAECQTLFVTSTRVGLEDAALERQPDSGRVFSILGLGVRGLLCQPYRGRVQEACVA